MGAIALAGSLTVLAWVDRIQEIRPSGNKNVKPKIEFSFDRAAAHGDASKDVLLQPGDIIYVPPTVLFWLLSNGGSTEDSARYRSVGY